MKRISLVLALLALPPGVTKAHWGWYGGVRYSPYALSYYSTGLIRGSVDYTPHALSYHNSGLVEGYGVGDTSHGFAFSTVGVRRAYGAVKAAHTKSARYAAGNPPVTHPPAPDGLNTIRQYLRDRGFAAASVNRILRIDSKLVGADFTLADQKLVIRYWDPKEIEQLSSKPAGVQRLYEQHRQAWESYAEQHRQTGGEVYCVEASDPQTIVASLQSCPRLDTGDSLMGLPVMYAKD